VTINTSCYNMSLLSILVIIISSQNTNVYRHVRTNVIIHCCYRIHPCVGHASRQGGGYLLWSSSLSVSPCPVHYCLQQDLAAITAQEPTHALLHPPPCGPLQCHRHCPAPSPPPTGYIAIFDAALPTAAPIDTPIPIPNTSSSPLRPPQATPQAPASPHPTRYATPRVGTTQPCAISEGGTVPNSVPSPRLNTHTGHTNQPEGDPTPSWESICLAVRRKRTIDAPAASVQHRTQKPTHGAMRAANHVGQKSLSTNQVFRPITFTNSAPLTVHVLPSPGRPPSVSHPPTRPHPRTDGECGHPSIQPRVPS
jgi:hypothetical protein